MHKYKRDGVLEDNQDLFCAVVGQGTGKVPEETEESEFNGCGGEIETSAKVGDKGWGERIGLLMLREEMGQVCRRRHVMFFEGLYCNERMWCRCCGNR